MSDVSWLANCSHLISWVTDLQVGEEVWWGYVDCGGEGELRSESKLKLSQNVSGTHPSSHHPLTYAHIPTPTHTTPHFLHPFLHQTHLLLIGAKSTENLLPVCKKDATPATHLRCEYATPTAIIHPINVICHDSLHGHQRDWTKEVVPIIKNLITPEDVSNTTMVPYTASYSIKPTVTPNLQQGGLITGSAPSLEHLTFKPHIVPLLYSEKFLRVKTFVNFVAICQVFSSKFLGRGIRWQHKWVIHESFLCKNRILSQNFSPSKVFRYTV